MYPTPWVTLVHEENESKTHIEHTNTTQARHPKFDTSVLFLRRYWPPTPFRGQCGSTTRLTTPASYQTLGPATSRGLLEASLQACLGPEWTLHPSMLGYGVLS